MKIRESVPISSLTTMRLGGAAEFVIEIEELTDIEAAFGFAAERNLPIWFMGGGANTIGHDEGYDGVILLNRLQGIEILDQTSDSLTVKAYSGEVWDDLVKFTCEKGYSGIEAMSMIPGTVGAAPVQNIGAYGQDISKVILELEAYDTKTQSIVTIPAAEMGMGYRHTRFNSGEDAGRFLILSITIKLQKTHLEPPFYNSLQRYVDEHQITDFSPANIRRIVMEIRAEKLPDPAEVPSAGSFFKNVYLNPADADAAEAKGIPIWREANGNGKINSGWLIESAGLKGRELYGFRVSDKAALVLINEHAKRYADLSKARAEIIQTVADKFGYTLEQEPVELQ